MACEPRKPDGVLTFVIDDKLDINLKNFPREKLVYHDKESGEIHFISAYILDAICRCMETESLLSKQEEILASNPNICWQDIRDVQLDFHERKLSQYEKAVEEGDFLPSLTRSIVRGNIDLVFLLNTVGGNLSLANLIKRILIQIRAGTGSVAAFAGERANSAGVHIFSMADREHRYIRGDTRLFHHLPDAEVLEDMIDEYRAIMIDLVGQENNDIAKSAANEALNDPENPNAEIHLDAIDSYNLRIATVVPSLTREFENFVGIQSLDEVFGGTEVAEFFKKQDVTTASEYEKFEAEIEAIKTKFLSELVTRLGGLLDDFAKN